MAFPTQNTTMTPSAALSSAQSMASQIKGNMQAMVDVTSAGDIQAQRIMQLPTQLLDYKQKLEEAAAVSGVGQYAKDQFNDQSFDVVVEFNAMITAIDNVITWVTTNFPNTNGNLHVFQFDVDGRYTNVVFTTAQTAGLRTELNGLIATIN